MTWPRLPLHLPSTRCLQKFTLSFQDACGHVGVGRGSQQQQPMRIRPAWLPAQRPGRGRRPIEIRRFLGISLESTSLWGVPQWSILRPILHPQHSELLNLRTNENSDRSICLDRPEIRGVYKPARNDPRQDSTANRQRDNFSGFGLSSPALQQPPTKPFSGSPSRQHLTDLTREAREAGRQRPGIVYPLPRAARPDTRLVIDAALPEAAALDHRERPPTVVDIPEPGRTAGNRLPGPLQQRGLRSPRRHSRKQPRNRSSGVYRPKKCSPHRGHWCE